MSKNRTHRKRRLSFKAGLPPGELVAPDGPQPGQGTIRLLRYSQTDLHEEMIADFRSLPEAYPENEVVWLNVMLPSNAAWTKAFGDKFAINPLVLEDIFDRDHRPKFEDADNYNFIILQRILPPVAPGEPLRQRQFSLLFKEGLVITFQDEGDEELSVLYERIRQGKGKVRRMKSDYLAYAILDVLVDQYFAILDRTGEELDDIELAITTKSREWTEALYPAFEVKRELMQVRRAVWPVREVLTSMLRDSRAEFAAVSQTHLLDLQDHVMQILETIEAQRDTAASLLDLNMSIVNNRMNAVMRILTVISTIFIPLTFIAGVYGMNFENMPELKWEFSYFICLLVMFGIAALMLLLFRRNKWF